MKERPILFSAPMVRALLDGSKTQTRRVAAVSHLDLREHDGGVVTWSVHFSKARRGVLSSYSGAKVSIAQAHNILASQFCQYGSVGDRLWVRETHAIVPRTAYAHSDGVQQTLRPNDDHDAAIYRAGWERSTGGLRWLPSIHMPRWASRLLLEITDVRVERLQDISEADALAEGIVRQRDDGFGLADTTHYHSADPRISYWSLWEAINGPGSVDANPWVWAVSFRPLSPGEHGRAA